MNVYNGLWASVSPHKTLRRLSVCALAATMLLFYSYSGQAQAVPAPQINLSGNVGAIGFPILNSGTFQMPSDANVTFGISNVNTSAFSIKVTSAVSLTATRSLIYPAGRFRLSIENATTGGQSLSISFGSGSACTVTNGATITEAWFDGTNCVQGGSGGGGGIPTSPTNALVKINGSNGAASSLSDNGTAVSTTEGLSAINMISVGTGGQGGPLVSTEGTAFSGATSNSEALYGVLSTHTLDLISNNVNEGHVCTSGNGQCGTTSGQAAGVVPLSTATATIGAQSHINENTSGVTAVTQPLSAPTLISGTPSSGALAALPTGAHGVAGDESSTAGVPATGVDYLRAKSGIGWVQSINGGAESVLGGATSVPSIGTLQQAAASGAFATTNIQAKEYIDSPRGWDATFMAGIYNAASAPVHVVVLGDSFSRCWQTQCGVGPALASDRWPDQLANKLASLGGAGSHGTGLVPILANGAGGADTGWALAGTTAYDDNRLGPWETFTSQIALLDMSPGATATYTTTTAYDTPEIYYGTTSTSGDLVITVDGSAAGTANAGSATASGTTNAGMTAREFTGTTFSAGTHTFVATCNTGHCYLYGGMFTNGASGVDVSDLAVGGSDSLFYGNAATTQLAFSDLIPGGTQLVVSQIEINDANAATSPSVYATALTAIIQHEQALSIPLPPSFLMTLPGIPVQPTGPMIAPLTSAALTVAQTLGVGLGNLQDRVGFSTTPFTGNVTSGTNTITGVSATGLFNGQIVIGPGVAGTVLPTGDTIVSGAGTSTLTMNQNSAASATGAALGGFIIGSGYWDSTGSPYPGGFQYTHPSAALHRNEAALFYDAAVGSAPYGSPTSGGCSTNCSFTGTFTASDNAINFFRIVGGAASPIPLNVESSSTAQTAFMVKNTSSGGKQWNFGSLGSVFSGIGLTGDFCLADATSVVNAVCYSDSTVTHNGVLGVGWAAGDPFSTSGDTFLWRAGAKTVTVGNATPGDFSGTLVATQITGITMGSNIYNGTSTMGVCWFATTTGPCDTYLSRGGAKIVFVGNGVGDHSGAIEAGAFTADNAACIGTGCAVFIAGSSVTTGLVAFNSDSGLSRCTGTADCVAVGNGTAGDISGTLKVATGTFGTGVTVAGNAVCQSTGTNCPTVSTAHNDVASISSTLFATATMLGPVFYEPVNVHLKSLIARLSGTISCTVAPIVIMQDLGTSPSTAYGSAIGNVTTLTTATSDGVFQFTGNVNMTAGDYYGFGFSAGTCVTAPQFDITATVQ